MDAHAVAAIAYRRLRLRQQRFFATGTDPTDETLWHIPLTFPGEHGLQQTVIMQVSMVGAVVLVELVLVVGGGRVAEPLTPRGRSRHGSWR